jgi:predicted nucleotidyltransferase
VFCGHSLQPSLGTLLWRSACTYTTVCRLCQVSRETRRGKNACRGGCSVEREEILRILARFRERKQDEFGIVRLGVFGSVARERATEASDVDVVVELDDPDLLAVVGVKQELEELLHLPTDVVRYREAMNPYLKRRIEQEAIYV